MRIGDPGFQEESYRFFAEHGPRSGGGFWHMDVRLPEDFTTWEPDETDGPEDPLYWCGFTAMINAAAEYKLREAVRWARQAGRSWQQIGDAIGMTRQSAWQRFGPDE